jgi:hypothetical protein
MMAAAKHQQQELCMQVFFQGNNMAGQCCMGACNRETQEWEEINHSSQAGASKRKVVLRPSMSAAAAFLESFVRLLSSIY